MVVLSGSLNEGAGRRNSAWRWTRWHSVWACAISAFLVLWLFGKPFGRWMFSYPRSAEIPIKRWIGDFMKWLVDDASFGLFTFTEMTRLIAAIIEFPYRIALSVLSTGFLQGQGSDAVQILPPVSWIAVVAIFAMLSHFAGGRKLALLIAACFGFLALFGQWDNAMITLASILIAVPIGVVGGLVLGIAGYRWNWFALILKPILDLMQTVPVFRLPCADSVPFRFRSDGGGGGHHHLCPPADDAHFHACPGAGAGRGA